MQMYISEKEVMFIVVQACENMSRMEHEMRSGHRLIKFDNYVQWHHMYEKFSQKIDFNYGDPVAPKILLRELSDKDPSEMDIMEGSGSAGK